jgi:hypothetical protein
LVIAFPVRVLQVVARRLTQGTLVEENHPVQAFLFQTAVEAFAVGMAIGGLRRQQDGLDAGFLHDSAKCEVSSLKQCS